MYIPAVAMLLLLASPAIAQEPRTNLGTLTCTVADEPTATARPASEERAMSCVFRPARDGAEQTYGGRIVKVGARQLPGAKLVLIWVVQGPDGAASTPGVLAQSYIGQPAEGAGRTPVLLTGQKDRRIVLQSSTPTGDPDAGVVTVIDLELRSVPA